MRILLIHNKYQQAGGEDVAFDVEVRLLRQKGHEVDTLLFDNNDIQGLVTKVKKGLEALYNFRSAHLIGEALLRFRPDIVHVHNIFFSASPSVIRVAASHGVPVVYSMHNYRLICANALLLRDNQVCHLCVKKTFPLEGIRYKCYRGSAVESGMVTLTTGLHKVLGTWRKKVAAYIVNTQFARSVIYSSSLLPPDGPLHVLANFVFDPGPGTGVGGRQDFYLFVGRIAPEKGVNVLLEVFARLPDSRVLIIGDGPDKNRLEAAYQSCKNIIFAGKKEKPEVLQAMRECRALLFPSIWYEGLPYTIMEAFGTGTPVFASNIGALGEIIQDGFNGYHFAPGDAEGLQSKIAYFEGHPEEQERLYENARKTYVSTYHPDVHYASLLSIYENLLNVD
jgi:glycosyltransferase involved in cell wall biosynthesis